MKAISLTATLFVTLLIAGGVLGQPVDEPPAGSHTTGQEAQGTNDNDDEAGRDSEVDSELDAFLAKLKPLSVDDIIKSLKPIPTLKECLSPLLDDSKAPYKHVLAEEEKEEVERLEGAITDLRKQAKYAEAIPLAETVLGIRSRSQGRDHWMTADARWQLETLHSACALSLDQRGRLATADSIEKDIGSAFEQARYSDATSLSLLAVKIREQLLGVRHPETLIAMNDLGACLTFAGRPSDGEPCTHLALNGLRRVLGENHPATLDALGMSAIVALQQGKYQQAVDLTRCAFGRARRTLGPDARRVIRLKANLGSMLQNAGDYSDAKLLLRSALEKSRIQHGPTHPDTVDATNNLATLLYTMGHYTEAEPLFREALEANLASRGADHADTLNVMANLALTLESLGNPSAAEPLVRRALEASRRTLGRAHPKTLVSLNTLAGLLVTQGDDHGAEQLYREVVRLRTQAASDVEPSHLANSLNSLGLLLRRQDKFDEADVLLQRALDLRLQSHGESHLFVGDSWHNLAMLRFKQRQFARAEKLFRRALDVYRHSVGPSHPKALSAKRNLGRLLLAMTRYAEAAELAREVQQKIRAVLGLQHPDTVNALTLVGRILYETGDYDEAERFFADAAQGYELARVKVAMSGLERAGFAAASTPLVYLSACAARKTYPAKAWRWREADLSRGLLDDLTARRARPLSDEEWRREEQLRRRIGELHQQVLVILGANETAEKARAWGDELRGRRDALQADLAQHKAEMTGKYGPIAGEVYSLDRIQGELSGDTALLLWLDIEGQPKAANPNGDHWACVVRSVGDPIWVKLPGSGDGGVWTDEDDQLPSLTREAMSKHRAVPPSEWLELVRKLRVQRIEPIKPHIDGVSHLIVLPAGWMAGVPVEALMPDTDDLAVSYAPSGTIYAWLKEARKKSAAQPAVRARKLLAIGDPPFDEAQLAEMAREHEGESTRVLALGVARGSGLDAQVMASVSRGSAELRGQLTRLPGTRAEALLVSRAFGNEKPRVGKEATEQYLVGLCHGNKLGEFTHVHFATHAIADSDRPWSSSIILSQVGLPDAFEAALTGERIYDGALDAGEILREWRGKLSAKLVVLSGCETALGKEAGGEGFLGFAQAFLLAGAENLILSLWTVDDAATVYMMDRFYELHVGGEQTIAASLSQAKKELRVVTLDRLIRWAETKSKDVPSIESLQNEWENRKKRRGGDFKPFEHPRYWAAFIHIGADG